MTFAALRRMRLKLFVANLGGTASDFVPLCGAGFIFLNLFDIEIGDNKCIQLFEI